MSFKIGPLSPRATLDLEIGRMTNKNNKAPLLRYAQSG